MKPKTLRALYGAIEKWEGIASGKGVDRGVANCPLCRLFYRYGCIDCPVALKSGHSECRNTPYGTWCVEATARNGGGVAITPRAKRAARAEVEFLKSLLPEVSK